MRKVPPRLRRPLRLRTAGKTGGGKSACRQRNGLASREFRHGISSGVSCL
jgi:hypothetical protein